MAVKGARPVSLGDVFVFASKVDVSGQRSLLPQ